MLLPPEKRRGENVTHEWDALIKNFNKHKYTVTDCTDKEFVGINIKYNTSMIVYS